MTTMEKKPVFVRSSVLLLLFFFACFVVWPVVCMFSSITREGAVQVFSSVSFQKALCSSLLSACLTTVFSMLLAFFMAVPVCRTAVAGKAVWQEIGRAHV